MTQIFFRRTAKTLIRLGERGGSVVECRTPEREVRGSRPTAAVLCPWARHFTPRKYWLITQEAMAPSRYDWKIVDWDVKPQHNQPTWSDWADLIWVFVLSWADCLILFVFFNRHSHSTLLNKYIDPFLKAWILAFCGQMQWKKLRYEVESTNIEYFFWQCRAVKILYSIKD